MFTAVAAPFTAELTTFAIWLTVPSAFVPTKIDLISSSIFFFSRTISRFINKTNNNTIKFKTYQPVVLKSQKLSSAIFLASTLKTICNIKSTPAQASIIIPHTFSFNVLTNKTPIITNGIITANIIIKCASTNFSPPREIPNVAFAALTPISCPEHDTKNDGQKTKIISNNANALSRFLIVKIDLFSIIFRSYKYIL